jgi:hypothetical protein
MLNEDELERIIQGLEELQYKEDSKYTDEYERLEKLLVYLKSKSART